MKIAIDNNGMTIEVPDDIVVKTIDGLHYLLNEKELEDIQIEESKFLEELPERKNKEITDNRKQAYVQESDPLLFLFMRDEVTKQEWLNKIQEIKERFPRV